MSGSSMLWRGWLLLVVVVTVTTAKGKKQRHHKPGRAVLDRLSSTTVGEIFLTGGDRGLAPAPVDVAVFAIVEANATCGYAGPEEYCRDTPGKRGIICDVCDGLSGSPARQHPAPAAVDGDPATWWQSPVLAAGAEYAHVQLIATMPDKMELLHVIIKSGPSPRPLAWSLEVSPSESGENWRLVKAFGDREHCRRLWDLRPERRRRKARAAKRSHKEKPSCSTQFASPKPLENGEMHVAIGEGTLARRVRVSFRAPHPLPAGQQYYTVREMTLAARCICHGHADSCRVDAKGSKCDCQHDTCGQHCQRCCGGGAWSARLACAPGRGCACAERGQCDLDDTGAILCVNCTDNRAGPLCDRCLVGFYNAIPDGPCLPCDCDSEGSDGSCDWDHQQHEPQCSCNPGFTGPHCDLCEDPLATFPACLTPSTTPACKCDPRGIVDPSRTCDEVCDCKVNVVGERCDTCAPGHFGLHVDLPAGCRPCYCSRRAASCVAQTEPSEDMLLPLGAAWRISDLAENQTADPEVDDQGKPFLISDDVEDWESFYWMTTTVSGSQLSLYGSEIRASMFWGVVRGDTGGNPTEGPDVILLGADGTKLAFSNTTHEIPGLIDLAVPLFEDGWYNMDDPSETIDRSRLMDVLADLRGIMLRAHFHMDQDEVRLESSTLVAAGAGVTELCHCGAGYAGEQCERCAWSYAPLQNQCVPCDCNNHADCDSVGGPCGACQHNTTGVHCERCLPGHYGNPVQGSCKPCACPLYEPSNNFSPNCALAAAEGDEFVCTQCPDGYSGDHCEQCDSGYWGSPATPGGACLPCACGGAACHPRSGACHACAPHAEGAQCERCQEGYWQSGNSGGGGNASSCVECACGAGALAAACDARSGQCLCRAGWAGRACDRCADGHGGIAAGCPACHCGLGAARAACDAETGACACAAGAAPPTCDQCLPEYYALSSEGCIGCNCSVLGSESGVCDIRSGQCRCKPHVTGRACDTCEEGYWGLQLGGCRRCACGAGAAACEPASGLCACAAGVGGAACDACLPGFYGFGPNGCLQCPDCDDGKVCSPESGRCVCPPRTRGPGCRQCAPGAWRRGQQCLPCQCGPGAVSDQCDASTGACACRAGWAGVRCEHCAAGHAGPRCRRCACDPAGSRGPCDQHGRCQCKENVVGERCDRCLEGTFGLSADSALGCTACFCFGRGVACAQAQLARAALHAAAPTHLTLQRSDQLTDVDQDSLLSIHTRSRDASISIPQPPVPVYMELGPRFLGDKVTSYGGFLKFRVEEEGGDPLGGEALARFPLVRIYGRRIVLDYYERIPPDSGWHSVRLHESLWQVRGAGGAGAAGGVASRSALMLALSKVERILLRVSTRAPTYQDKVHALLLNVSLDTTVPGHSRAESALGVELCDCDARFAPPSCHAPAPGFWMPTSEVHYSEVAGTIVITLEGEAKPCNCNGRATKCDPDNGHCINCTGQWSGPTCATCAAGYYLSGGACAPCACSAPPCPRPHPHCQCPPGYSGRDCTDCSAGYFRTDNATCAACGCHPRGALASQCDARGRCRCRPFATGDRCDRCLGKTQFLHEDGCKECDNCTQTLLTSVEKLTSDLHRRADVNELSRIPKPYAALREFTQNATIAQTNLERLAKELENSRNIKRLIHNLEGNEHEVFTKANKLKSEASRRAEEASFLSLESMTGLEEAMKFRQKIGVQVMDLDEFARGEKHTSAHRALKEARHLLRQIKEMKLNGYLTGANDVFDSAHLQSTAIQEYKYRTDDLSRRLTALISRLDTLQSKSEDFKRFGDVIWDAGDMVEATVKEVKPKMAKIKDVALRCRLVSEDIASLSPHNLTLNTNYAILSAQTLARHFPSFTSELRTLSAAAEEKEGILYELTPKYREKYLKQVEMHVAELSKKAKEYQSVFAGARAASSSGVEAARAWSDVATAVREAARAATHAQAAASSAAALARPQTTLKDRARESEDVSRELRGRAMELLKRAEELRGQLEQLRRGGDVVSIALRSLGWQERDLGQRPRADVHQALRDAGTVAERVFATTRALYDEASEIRRRVRYTLRRQLAELQRHSDTAVSAAQEHVSQILRSSERGSAAAAALGAAAAARRAEQAAAGGRLAPSLAALRRSVASALHAASSISVSITSVPGASVGCSRLYTVHGQSPTVNRYSIDVSFDGVVRDGPLLTVLDDTKEPHHFIKLLILNQHFHLTWELGGGTGLIIHPDLLLASHDDADHTSYRVQIERIWSTVHLTVEKAGQPPSTTSNSTTGSTNLFPHKLWLGGPEGGLPGCVHSLKTRDEVLGLWSGTKSSGKCTGCTQRFWSTGAARQNMVYFNGRGYTALRRSDLRPADPRHFSISFSFRTMDQDALLFLAVDEANNRSVSISLRACRVEFAVQYAGARLRLAAAGRHCGGRPAYVQATRVFSRLDKGSLRVNGEETLGSPSPPVQSLSALPDLSRALYWVGGVGPAPALHPPGAPPLRGCVGGLAVDREGYDLMDTTMRHGVEPVCGTRSLYSAIFDGGYVELPSPILRRKSSLGLNFKSRTSDGLLLYRVPSTQAENDSDDEDDDSDEKHYLVIQMVKGEIEVIASAGKDEVHLRTNGTRFDDNQLHSLRLVRQHKQIELWIDDTKMSSATFAGNAIPARSKGLFLGGTSETALKTTQGRKLITAGAFEGTIADVIVDSTLIGLEAAVNWTNVQLGRSDIDAEAEQRTEPRALHSQPDPKRACSKTSSYTVEAGAAKFGDAPGSYARLRTPVKGSEIVYSLQFRTYAPNGLILFAPGPKSKPKHYLALLVRERRLRLVVRGRKRKEVALPTNVTDGVWRTVTIRAGRGRVVMRLEGSAVAATGGSQRARHVLLGAVPAELLPRPISKVGGFRGCIRRVAINGRPEDIVRDAKSHRGLGQCFPNVEPGAYFGGDAYAIWTKSYSPSNDGSEISSELRLEFRTMSANGVLLAAPPLLLMLKDGMVVFSRTTASGTVSAEWRGAGGSGACDGRWHAVLARASRGALALQVDGSHVSAPAASLLADEPAPTALYVCAVPEGTIDPTESKEPFRGCIRNLSVGGHKKDWTEMDHLHNVLLDSCPAQQ